MENIVKITNLSRVEIDQILNEFLYYRAIHEFLSYRKNNNLPLPKTQTEMQLMITQDKSDKMDLLRKRMYDNIKRMLGYSNRFVKKQESKKYKTFTYEF